MSIRHDDEYKKNAVRLANKNGIKAASDELEISYSTLRTWIAKFGDQIDEEAAEEPKKKRRGRRRKKEKDPEAAAAAAPETAESGDDEAEEVGNDEEYTQEEPQPDQITSVGEAEDDVASDDVTSGDAAPDVSEEQNADAEDDEAGDEASAYENEDEDGISESVSADEDYEENDAAAEYSGSEDIIITSESEKRSDSGQFENYFFVDYENVKRSGLEGMEQLSENDCVRIYYGLSDRLPFDLHKKMLMSAADFEYVEIDLPIKNALDCRLLFDIEDFSKFDVSKNYYIVSNDTDYDNSIKMFGGKGMNICKLSKISEYVRQGFLLEKEIADILKPIPLNVLSLGEKRLVMEIIIRSAGKNSLNRKLNRFFFGQRLKTVWKYIKPLTDKLPDDN